MVCKTERRRGADAADGDGGDGGEVRALLGTLGMGIEQQGCQRSCRRDERNGGPEERISQRCGDVTEPQHASGRKRDRGQAGKERAHARGGRGACRAEPKGRDAGGDPGGKDDVAG